MRIVYCLVAFIACFASTTESKLNLSGPELLKLMKNGTNVIRGADWKWEYQDGNGEGQIISDVYDGGWIRVKWNTGNANSYRMGKDGKYDLTLAGDVLEPTSEVEQCTSNLTIAKAQLEEQMAKWTKIIETEKKKFNEANRKLEEKQMRTDELESIIAKLNSRLEASNKNLFAATKLLAPFLPQTEQSSANKQFDVICENFTSETKVCEVADFEVTEVGMEIGSVLDKKGEKVKPTTLIIRDQPALFLPTNLKDAFPGLKKLEVSGCGIFLLNRKTFQGLDQLESLKLKDNKLSSINGGIFNDLKKLVTLDLSNNHIEAIRRDTFNGLVELKVFKINDNQLKNIAENFSAPMGKLESIDLIDNVCINSSYTTTSLDQMKAWIIDKCIPPIQFECGPSTSSNICRAVNLTIEYPKTKIAKDVGSNQTFKDITELYIEDQLVSFLPLEIAKTFPKLQKLIVSRSQLTALSKNDFDGLTDLTHLEICDNSLSSIDADAFRGVSQLEHLDLSSNHIQTLPANVFEPLTHLLELRLSINDLKVLDSNIFPAVNAIKVFKIDNNKLEVIDTGILRNLKRLHEIDLSGNICVDEKYQKADESSQKALGALIGVIFIHCSAE